ncbi:unnamed protein product [Spodoptera littoralis]|uniref:Zinc finger protein n=1 Tax=Spodoptera littoralis TaxID=7109 RepID=A0A9P0N587_SPOLI|nr:unnamed protein product [Spodoptera littoralis]CAH1642018.1 unnamed protein product [Spodoptera littoralis]
MDTEMKNVVDDIQSSVICRCCLDSGCFQNMSSEYYNSGQKEVYEDMLKSTFDIQVTEVPQTTKHYICEPCITRLRDARTFKQMVLQNEEHYLQMIRSMKWEPEIASTDDVKSDDIKYEPPDLEFTDDIYDEDDDDVFLDDVKNEITQKKTILETEIKITRLRKTKKKIDNDWTKIAERRGNGPILRDNSLKLLANSTILIFQWDKSRYRCFCCKEPFSDMNLLREHSITHTLKEIEKKIIDKQNRFVKVDISILKCKLCNETLQNLKSLQTHLTDAHDLTFELNDHLLIPFKIGGELSCQICAEKFHVFRLLNIHMNKHYQNQVCHICGAGFSTALSLTIHKSRCHKAIKCRYCDMTFKRRPEKRQHEIQIHNAKYERKLRFPCPYCTERFFQENLRVEHLIREHGFKQPEFQCKFCSKCFITKSLCTNHTKIVHLRERKYECDVCHDMFFRQCDVIRHKVKHTGEKNFSCTECNNCFASKDSLRRHMKRAHDCRDIK